MMSLAEAIKTTPVHSVAGLTGRYTIVAMTCPAAVVPVVLLPLERAMVNTRKPSEARNSDDRSCVDACFVSNPIDPACTDLDVKEATSGPLPAPLIRTGADQLCHKMEGKFALISTYYALSFARSIAMDRRFTNVRLMRFICSSRRRASSRISSKTFAPPSSSSCAASSSICLVA